MQKSHDFCYQEPSLRKPGARVDAIEFGEDGEEFGVVLSEFGRLFEERFGDDGEEFFRLFGGVRIDPGPVAVDQVLNEGAVFLSDDRPAALERFRGERGLASHLAIEAVEMVGHFVEDDIFAIVWVLGTLENVRPGETNVAVLPGIAQDLRMAMVGPSFATRPRRNVFGIELNRGKSLVQIAVITGEQHHGLGGDDDFHFFGEFEAVAAGPNPLGDHDAGFADQACAQFSGQKSVQRHVTAQCLFPQRRHGGAEKLATTCGSAKRPGEEHGYVVVNKMRVFSSWYSTPVTNCYRFATPPTHLTLRDRTRYSEA